MANWRATLDVKTKWQQSDANKEKVTELVTAVVAWMDSKLKTGIFKVLLHGATHTRATVKWGKTRIAKFDRVWNELYNWADRNLVWVKTF